MHTVLIMGAAGRDFHTFNVLFRNKPEHHVAAFTAAQIPDIDDRRYPPELAGEGYPDGIPIHPEEELEVLIARHAVDTVVFAYSDISHEAVMHAASRVNSAGADFVLASAVKTMLRSRKPVIAVCAVRTGCGKSPVTREVSSMLKACGKKPVIIRHPMPYGDLTKQAVQRFATLEDMDKHNCTIEEREEYEHHIEQGYIVYAGIDYLRILEEAEKEADIILWDGGNNDTPFIAPDVHITLLDPLRAGHETRYHPGETNLRMADIALINKVNSADEEFVQATIHAVKKYAPDAALVLGDSIVTVDDPELVEGKSVLLVEDGPTLTHGEMAYGAASIAAENHNAASIADPRPHARKSIAFTYAQYRHLGAVLPAMGYSSRQLTDLEETINHTTSAETVLLGTPIRLDKLISITKPVTQVRYTYRDADNSPISLQKAILERLETLAIDCFSEAGSDNAV